MIKILCNQADFKTKTGVYVFRNIINRKIYIGSTVTSFEKRFNNHVYHLRNGTHRNKHFQNAWDKYGEDYFEYDIIEICSREECLSREQFYLDKYLFAKDFINNSNKKFIQLGYNINPLATGTPNLSKETVKKRSQTFKQTMNEAMNYYYLIKNHNIDMDDIPDKYINIVQGKLNYTAWNTGKGGTYNTDYLKVPKTITRKVLNARKVNSEKSRNKSVPIAIYDIHNNLISVWRSKSDIQDASIKHPEFFPIIYKGKIKTSKLSIDHIGISCRTGKSYKGLYFKEMPDWQGTINQECANIGEDCDVNPEINSKIA